MEDMLIFITIALFIALIIILFELLWSLIIDNIKKNNVKDKIIICKVIGDTHKIAIFSYNGEFYEKEVKCDYKGREYIRFINQIKYLKK
jgi:hypothetical protein